MNGNDKLEQQSNIMVELIHNLKSADVNDLCDAAEAAIIDGGGFGLVGRCRVPQPAVAPARGCEAA